MQFIKVNSPSEATSLVLKALTTHLDNNQKILWLLSGGSNIGIAIDVLNSLNPLQLNNLTATLVDERYGTIDNAESNERKLQKAGFDFSKLSFVDVLDNKSETLEETATNFEIKLEEMFNNADVIVGLFGIGSDGHTAGILPYSDGAKDTKSLVVSYVGNDYSRISLSFSAITKIDEAYVIALGEEKTLALTRLHDENFSLAEQPAQIFRQSTMKSIIINNIIGDYK